MKRVPVNFWDADSVLQFIKIISRYEDDLELVCQSCCVDAKSLLAVFSMRSAREAELLIHGDSCEKLMEDLDSYIGYAQMCRRKDCFQV